ncbi:hypothetical protein OTU49_001473 [Cherax quadricarinatus]|uniref:Uncharacterized protein n=1 Tax=Cherax quadricarinatus TaxID=27406 RepID=A0AAW0XUU6_CHEQU
MGYKVIPDYQICGTKGIEIIPQPGTAKMSETVWRYTRESTDNISVLSQQGSSADHMETNKVDKYRKLDHPYPFIPMGSKTCGPWREEKTLKVFRELNSRLILTT